jgi:hypothetical protein
MTTCPACETTFTPRRANARYCSTPCQSKAANERTNARRDVKTLRPSLRLVKSEDPSEGQRPASPEGVLKPLEVEWLDCGGYHRAVAGRLNKGNPILREWAVGMDRPPLGHALMLDGEWIGKVRA